MGKIRNYRAMIQQYGLRRCLFRLRYDFERKTGLLKRKFPAWRWEQRPLSYWLKEGVPAEPERYREVRESSTIKFFFPLGQPPRPHAEWASNAIEQADMLLKGKMRFFSCLIADTGYPDIDWHRNPFTGQRASAQQHWCDRSDFDAAVGDIKFIWEPSRFGWAYALVRAYAVSRDDKYAEAFWRMVESWMMNNPPQMGPNWQCGQEIALRTQACIFALYVFWNSPATTAERISQLVCLLAASAERIAGNINYARSQMSNHAASEAAGLYIIGLMFPELKQANHWRKLGRRVLEDEARQHNWPDGSYVQHSMNYQRMTLHNYLLCLRLGELNAEQFSDLTIERLKKSYEFLYQLQDAESGRVPNYGANDGALILPLNSCDYLDYRPVIGSMHYLFHHEQLYPPGCWQEDLLWLFGPEALESDVRPIERVSSDFLTGGYFILRGQNSWAMTRCHTYRNRPAQADMLHLDLWWQGVNVLRDSGSFSYFDPKEQWNLYFISTSSHNTVVVDGVDQMIKGPRFRWFSLLKSHFIRHVQQGQIEIWQGEHYGYQRLPCRATHRRTICRLGDDYWLIFDDIIGKGQADVELFWHLADFPCRLEDKTIKMDVDGKEVRLFVESTSRSINIRLERGLDGRERMGWQSLYYGQRTPAPTTCASVNETLPVRFVTLVSLGRESVITECSADSVIAWSEDGENVGRVELAPPGGDDKVIKAVRFGSDNDWQLSSDQNKTGAS